jgi:hypothetical protein
VLLGTNSIPSPAQIDLKVKICKGASVRKALVREAGVFEASKVVVGVAKKRRAIS